MVASSRNTHQQLPFLIELEVVAVTKQIFNYRSLCSGIEVVPPNSVPIQFRKNDGVAALFVNYSVGEGQMLKDNLRNVGGNMEG